MSTPKADLARAKAFFADRPVSGEARSSSTTALAQLLATVRAEERADWTEILQFEESLRNRCDQFYRELAKPNYGCVCPVTLERFLDDVDAVLFAMGRARAAREAP